MRHTIAIALLINSLGCAASAHGNREHVALEGDLIQRAFAAAPWDSISGDGSRFPVIALDPQVRRIPVAGTVDPLEHPVAFTTAFDAPSTLRTRIFVREHATRSARGDTLAVTFAVVGTVSPGSERAYVLLFMTSEQSYGIVGSIMFERRLGAWLPKLLHFQEG